MGNLDAEASSLGERGVSHKPTYSEVAGARTNANETGGRSVNEGGPDVQGAKQAMVAEAGPAEAKVAERAGLKGAGEGDALRASRVSRRVLDI